MIFYFSATGNSKYVATKINKEFGGELIDISKAYAKKRFEYFVEDEERVFFIFPTYFWSMPNIVSEFISELTFSGGRVQICAITTYSLNIAGVDRMFKRALKNIDADLKGFYKVAMVGNNLLLHDIPRHEEQVLILRKADKEISNIIESIRFNYRVTYKSGFFMILCSKAGKSFYNMTRKTKKFHVNNNCQGCGLCEEYCPTKTIKLTDGKPVWTLDKCEHCLGCINRCPNKAIDYGKSTVNRNRFMNINS